MNSIIGLINKHGSCRHYKPDPVPLNLIEAIVDAGRHASTSSNLQAYSVIAVTEETKRLTALCRRDVGDPGISVSKT